MINDILSEFDNPLDAIVGRSEEIKYLKGTILMAARGDFPVLLEGETGTGKDLAARVLHFLSKRRDKPFIAVNCSAVPEELLESEFFGHKKGAFTGAVCDSQGLFAAANGGTLFLDEIVEMPARLQAKLLRAIESKEIRKLGDQKPRKVNVRIIAATNRSVEEALRCGSLRRDLFYRISCVHIKLPPLRERKSDIPLLVAYFIRNYSRAYGVPEKKITERAMNALLYYSWPGNIRELENVIQRAFALGSSGKIRIKDFPRYIWDGNERKNESVSSVEDAERKLILDALRAAGGNKSKAARLLGIGRKALYRKLKKYGIQL